MNRLKRMGSATWKTLVGALLAQQWLSSILIVGWTYRSMQRVAVKRWGLIRDADPSRVESAKEIRVWPRWMLREDLRAHLRSDQLKSLGPVRRLRAQAASFFFSLWRNMRVGVPALLNTWVLTILPATLWSVGWYTGWDNSFNKGYEQYFNGIALSLIGIAIFLPVMLYLPMAQARQAITGEAKRFYDLRIVWTIARSRPLSSLFLAAAYSLVSFPITILKSFTLFADQVNPKLIEASDAAWLQWLNTYFFWVCVLGFIGYVFLHRLAARFYADAVYRLVSTGKLPWAALSSRERAYFERFGIRPPEESPERSAVIEAVGWVAKPVWRVSLMSVTLVVWFSFVAQIYLSEFLNYHPKRGFLNQPLVQMPWFRYVPSALEERVGNDRSR